jgi:hypothetical protein
VIFNTVNESLIQIKHQYLLLLILILGKSKHFEFDIGFGGATQKKGRVDQSLMQSSEISVDFIRLVVVFAEDKIGEIF